MGIHPLASISLNNTQHTFLHTQLCHVKTLFIMADKLRTQQELERLQAKYIGTGHPDTTSWEWRTNISRDTYSSLVGHPPQLAYISLAQNEPAAKVRAQLIRKMIQPSGPPPPREGEEHMLQNGRNNNS
ncbi:putative splicing factor 3B subunit 5 [Rosellinia necatrix]|uniref:Putative splicing factor 3B subunit 5 n=1 Tax=Rosellinia necatrix TaxID=77044 RepID=A0A1S8AA51_ROSNE|nr:putative splicing factor 3B subunit 5 [Rosellinia necatrix]